ncbi:MAG: protein-disulfide reductase DsbD domain-containing protein [Planctomycetota bacterium]
MATAVALSAGNGSIAAEQAPDDDHPASVSLVSELSAFHPGSTQWIGVKFELDDSWHIYWDGQNDTGMAPTVELDLPEGFSAGDIHWPTPHRYISPGGILDHVYEDEVTLLIPITIDNSVPARGRATISASLEWLVCAEVCIPGWGDSSIELPLSRGGVEPGAGFASVHAARSALTTPEPETQQDFVTRWSGDRLAIIPTARVERIAFYPGVGSLFVENLLGTGESGDRLSLPVDAEAEPIRSSAPGESPVLPKAVRGIVEIVRSPTAPPVRYSVVVPFPGSEHRSESGESGE